MSIFILDNSVLSAFHKTGNMKLLKKILSGHKAIVPDKVFSEIGYDEVAGQVAFGEHELSRKKWMLYMKTGPVNSSQLMGGEQAVLELAAKTGGWAVIDDLKARKKAKDGGVKYAGTITLLKKAGEKKMITRKKLDAIVKDLKEKDSFRMTQELEDWLLE